MRNIESGQNGEKMKDVLLDISSKILNRSVVNDINKRLKDKNRTHMSFMLF